jgi:hypothetical protein
MKNILILFSLIYLCGRSNADEVISCEHAKDKPGCLLENYEKLKQNSSLLEKLYLAAEKQAVMCDKPKTTSNFLEVVNHIGGSAAIEEYFSEAMEKKLLLKNPKCFVKAISNTSAQTKEKICASLKNPTFLEKKQVDAIFKKYQGKAGTEGWIADCLKPSN